MFLRAVTYGPFADLRRRNVREDFDRIVAAGFNAIRCYEFPDCDILDHARSAGLMIFAGLEWGYHHDLVNRPGLVSAARVRLIQALNRVGDHPALAGVYVANEIPADLVRWMGAVRVREVLEELVDLGRGHSPQLLYAYANFPSTEYLELGNVDFTAFNIYLEDSEALARYLRRLHHVAGNRPLLISEFGLDTRRNGLPRQAELMGAALEIAQEIGCAGFTAYAWSDEWWNRDAEVLDWDFGLIDRQGNEKPALQVLRFVPPMCFPRVPRFSVIVCTRNGAPRIVSCLQAIRALHGDFELIVVDDGSTDGTGELVAATYPDAILLSIAASGLSAARNAGAAMASGELLAFTDDDCEPDCEWLLRLGKAFVATSHDALGGPNIPPRPCDWHQAVTDAAPGAPGHVMLNDVDAEHLPGCNLAVTRRAFDAVGGFDPVFHTAGDDVDFCWRLEDAGFRIGFVPDAFVWHHRRGTIRGYLRQQWGYGVAERELIRKHPQRFTNDGRAEWKGCIYAGRAHRVQSGDVIYHGTMGNAPYQKLGRIDVAKPQLAPAFDSLRPRVVLLLASLLARILREWARTRRFRILAGFALKSLDAPNPTAERLIPGIERDVVLGCLLHRGWIPSSEEGSWDLVWEDVKLVAATERDAKGFPSTWIRIAAPELDSRLLEQIVSIISSLPADLKSDADE